VKTVHKKVTVIGFIAIFIICTVFACKLYTFEMSKKYNLEDYEIYCSYNFINKYLENYVCNGETIVRFGTNVCPYSKGTPDVKSISRFENYLFIDWANQIMNRQGITYDESDEEYSSKYIYIELSDGEICKSKCVKPGYSLFAVAIFFCYYLRKFYYYVIPIWIIAIILFAVAFKDKDKEVVVLGRKLRFVTQKIAFILAELALAVSVWLLYRILIIQAEAIRDCVSMEYVHSWWKSCWRYDFKPYAFLVLGIIHTIMISSFNKDKPIKAAVAYIIPTGISYFAIYWFASFFNDYSEHIMGFPPYKNESEFLCNVHKYNYLWSFIKSHFFAYYGTILFVISFILYFIFSSMVHKCRKSISWSLTYSFAITLLITLRSFIGGYYGPF